MTVELDPLALPPWYGGTRLSFTGGEGQHFVVDVNAMLGDNQMRLRLVFSGVAEVRVASEADSGVAKQGVLTIVSNSSWLRQVVARHAARFGQEMAVVLSDVKHYVVCGHEGSIGLLANSRPAVIYVDVDDTLVRSAGSKRIPMPSTVKLVRALHDHGAALYLWSRGGASYAREVAEELGIAECFAAFLPKPDPCG